MSANDAAKLFREKADTFLEMTTYVRDEQKRRVLGELVEENEAKADLLERMMLTQESFSNFHAGHHIATVGHNMIEDNVEILVKPASWQNPGMPERWNWQVRQKHPMKPPPISSIGRSWCGGLGDLGQGLAGGAFWSRNYGYFFVTCPDVAIPRPRSSIRLSYCRAANEVDEAEPTRWSNLGAGVTGT